VSSPSAGASSAFSLGSGAFASFGSSVKTPKASNSTFDLCSSKGSADKRDPQNDQEPTATDQIRSKGSSPLSNNPPVPSLREHPLKSTWVVWYRPPTPKYSDYEKSTIALASISSVESFWCVYSHLKRPSLLPTVSDYHIFKKGIRPVWEDEANKKGGKWIIRLKKGVADRYWEDLLLAMVGDQFAEAGDEVCGAVLSVRGGEDVLSVWTRIDGGRNIKIRCLQYKSD
jgi:translation initiation factor 4E